MKLSAVRFIHNVLYNIINRWASAAECWRFSPLSTRKGLTFYSYSKADIFCSNRRVHWPPFPVVLKNRDKQLLLQNLYYNKISVPHNWGVKAFTLLPEAKAYLQEGSLLCCRMIIFTRSWFQAEYELNRECAWIYRFRMVTPAVSTPASYWLYWKLRHQWR